MKISLARILKIAIALPPDSAAQGRLTREAGSGLMCADSRPFCRPNRLRPSWPDLFRPSASGRDAQFGGPATLASIQLLKDRVANFADLLDADTGHLALARLAPIARSRRASTRPHQDAVQTRVRAEDDATSISLTSGVTRAVAFSKAQEFDQLGRLTQSIGVSSQTYRFGYDRTGNVTSVTDPISNVFSNGFDPLNRLISQTDELSQTVNLTRNGVDDITAYENPRNLTTSYVRNDFGEIIQETSPDRGTIVYARDGKGEVVQRVGARGQTLTYAYDLAGRISSETDAAVPNQNIVYQYDQSICSSDRPFDDGDR